MNDKRYYFLKLEETYFDIKVQKALRRLPSGAEMLICYLKIQLKYLNKNGWIKFSGICNDIEEEIALDIDEDVDLVRMTLVILTKWNVIEQHNEDLYLTEMQTRIGSKTDVALRVEKHRKKQEMLHSNKNETKCNSIQDIDIEKDIDIEIDSSNKNLLEEFEKLWELYPNKQGKSKALEYYKKSRLKKNVTFEIVKDGIERYNKWIIAEAQQGFIKHGSTWFNGECWNDVYISNKKAAPKPSWLGQDLDIERTTPEEEAEMQALLRNFK